MTRGEGDVLSMCNPHNNSLERVFYSYDEVLAFRMAAMWVFQMHSEAGMIFLSLERFTPHSSLRYVKTFGVPYTLLFLQTNPLLSRFITTTHSSQQRTHLSPTRDIPIQTQTNLPLSSLMDCGHSASRMSDTGLHKSSLFVLLCPTPITNRRMTRTAWLFLRNETNMNDSQTDLHSTTATYKGFQSA